MNNELEMKFAVTGDGLTRFRDNVLPELHHRLQQANCLKIDFKQKQLSNDYFDTADNYFSQHRFGFRVRGFDGKYEQTLKTQGTTTGGLHRRGEYNVALDTNSPNLSLFTDIDWPDAREPNELTLALEHRFSTNFERNEFTLTFDDAVVELVFDKGKVESDGDSLPIDELEIELKDGSVARVFEVANVLNNSLCLRLSDTTKAATGYHLIGESLIQRRPLPEYLAVNHRTSTEEAFSIAVECALSHWQYHEQAYLQTQKLKYLDSMYEGANLLLHSVSLYLPVLQCAKLLKLHKALISFTRKWQWVTELHSIRFLRSKRGPFSHYLTDHDHLMSYLQGRKMGLLQGRSADQLFFDPAANEIKIMASELIVFKPWQYEVTGAEKPVLEHARGWLSQGWQNVLQSLSQDTRLSHTHYIATENILRQALNNGFLLADLFDDEKGVFRAPWLDILLGVEELKALLALKKLLNEAEFDNDAELKQWTADKISNLLAVIERTRSVAIGLDAYW